jgi:hypothetical protein
MEKLRPKGTLSRGFNKKGVAQAIGKPIVTLPHVAILLYWLICRT